jgi:SOS response regulatory protein OraA/RecX
MNNQRINLNAHIGTLDGKIQHKITRQLMQCGFTQEDINLVLSGRLRDIKDNIELSEVFA